MAEPRGNGDFHVRSDAGASQMEALIAATGNAFTTVLAGLAFTVTSFPNMIFLPALESGQRIGIEQDWKSSRP